MQLSGNSIYDLCVASGPADPRLRDWLKTADGIPLPMISPFEPEKKIVNGKSYGLSVASYDLRIAHDLTLGPHPGYLLRDTLRDTDRYSVMRRHAESMHEFPPSFALAHTIEIVAIPLDVSGQICDKSTYARLGLSCFNTFFDPGFIGNCTLELVNLSPKLIIVRAGDPICQMVFNRLDRPVPKGYDGKFQHQPARAVGARLEGKDGSYVEA